MIEKVRNDGKWSFREKLHSDVCSPGGWSLSGASRPCATLQPARVCLYTEATALSAGRNGENYAPRTENQIKTEP